MIARVPAKLFAIIIATSPAMDSPANAEGAGIGLPPNLEKALNRLGLNAAHLGNKVGVEVTNSVESIIEHMSGTGNWTTERAAELLEKFDYYTPILERAGYEITHLTLVVGLATGLEVDVTEVRDVSDKIRDIRLRKYREDLVLKALLSSLYQISNIDVHNYHIETTQLFFSYAPHTKIYFVPKSGMKG